MFGIETLTPSVALKLFGKIHKQGLLDKAFRVLKQKQHIAVFGASGTGKSQLLLSLVEPLAPRSAGSTGGLSGPKR